MYLKFFITTTLLLIVVNFISAFPQSEQNESKARVARRINIPFLGIGPRCTDCPQHFCDDDPAIIHGYCCGCARFFDDLPIKCHGSLNCPLDGRGLCRDYEYMMHCCC